MPFPPQLLLLFCLKKLNLLLLTFFYIVLNFYILFTHTFICWVNFSAVSLPHMLADILLRIHLLLEVSLRPDFGSLVEGKKSPRLYKKLASLCHTQVEVLDEHLLMCLSWIPVSLGWLTLHLLCEAKISGNVILWLLCGC